MMALQQFYFGFDQRFAVAVNATSNLSPVAS